MAEFNRVVQEMRELAAKGLSSKEIATIVKLPEQTVRLAILTDIFKDIEEGSKQNA